MKDIEPDSLSGQSCQQLRYYQIRGEKWLLKLKLLILAVLCVLLGAFLIAFQVQAYIQDFGAKCDSLLPEYSHTLRNFSLRLSVQAANGHVTGWNHQGGGRHSTLYPEKDELIQQLQKEKSLLSSDVKEKEDIIRLLQIEQDRFGKELLERERIIQQLQEKDKQTCYPQYQCVGDACCAEGWKYFSGKCYYFSTDEKTWTESRDACVAAGGDLVIISSTEEQDFLKRSVSGWGEQLYWVGLTDAVTEGDWRWLDGTRLETPKYWTGKEPDNWKGRNNQYPEGEDCAQMHLNTDYYGLIDAFCAAVEKKVKRVCESKAVK